MDKSRFGLVGILRLFRRRRRSWRKNVGIVVVFGTTVGFNVNGISIGPQRRYALSSAVKRTLEWELGRPSSVDPNLSSSSYVHGTLLQAAGMAFLEVGEIGNEIVLGPIAPVMEVPAEKNARCSIRLELSERLSESLSREEADKLPEGGYFAREYAIVKP